MILAVLQRRVWDLWQRSGFSIPAAPKPSERFLCLLPVCSLEEERCIHTTGPWTTSTAKWKKERSSFSSSTATDTLRRDLTRLSQMTSQSYQSLPEGDTVFKQAFKKYKKRSEKLDLEDVVDVRVSDASKGLVCRPVQYNRDINNIGIELRPLKEWSISTFDSRPGLFILSNIITEKGQVNLASKCLLQYAEPPNITNLTVDGSYKEANVFRNIANKLRWVTMGNDYDWTQKVYDDKPRDKLPDEIVKFADLVSNVLGLGSVAADAVIMNFYPAKATLSPHVDRSERSIEKPLISISLGQSAIYLTGGESLDDPVDPLLLHSGDVLVMHGKQRLVYHAVPRILKLRTFPRSKEVDQDVLEYLNNCRVNVTIRQVDFVDDEK
ncbi:unnamed protein product [Bursaphelenchus okinawaensis]|uniref:Fe2OG dioxygenase domain-containing protein n=1 Tax=Bursaphelenchus okinawaensis TaxID=465554 RepID=A0A811KA58_9BILA|nr:unnamed protein product [Bursaphelenchus okinawaensis]CAG9095716.1 unnamed protein product [Bursaphelenchus okinawaensis]